MPRIIAKTLMEKHGVRTRTPLIVAKSHVSMKGFSESEGPSKM